MERLIIVIDCPDDWRERDRLDVSTVAQTICEYVAPALREDEACAVRVRWQSMDTDAG